MSDHPSADQPLAPKPEEDEPQLPTPPQPAPEKVVLPASLRTAATLQIVSGGINLLITWWVASSMMSFGFGMITAICTVGLCPFGVLAGLVSLVIIPLGILEIVAGVVPLIDPKSARITLPWLPWLQIASILAGGLTSAIFGIAVLVLLRDHEARAFLRQRY